ncbi:MAG: FecR domain-containing protein [Gammaproteobacteria bacterium]|nr:FecR domain-containing protein [Gammaproteobacteria bacterium]
MIRQQGLRTLLCAVLVLLSSVTWAKDQVARVVSVIGAVDVVRSENNARQPLAFKSLIYLNDRIITGVGSQAKLLLSDSSILKVGPSSELKVNEMVVGRNNDSKTTVDLIKGRLRSVIGKKLSANSHYEIHTSVAVAGVRGTDFEVLVVHDGETLVRSFEGVVAVHSLVEGVLGEVLLMHDTFTMVDAEHPPENPLHIAPEDDVSHRRSGGSGSGGRHSADDGDSGHDANDGDALQQAEADQVLGGSTGVDVPIFEPQAPVSGALGQQGRSFDLVPLEETLSPQDAIVNEQDVQEDILVNSVTIPIVIEIPTITAP